MGWCGDAEDEGDDLDITGGAVMITMILMAMPMRLMALFADDEDECGGEGW